MFPLQAMEFIRLRYLILAGSTLSILLRRNVIVGPFMNTNLLVLMELLLQSIRLKTHLASFMMCIQQEYTEKHIATLSLLSQSRIWQLMTMLSLLSSGNKLAVLV